MKYSDQPRKEVAQALSSIEAMKKSFSLDEFEENWKSFLRHIERIWNKVAHHYGKSPKWNGWKGKYEQLRKKDPLLSYFINARGAEEHTVNEIVSRDPGGIGINPAEGNSLYIEKMTINNGNITVKSPQKIRVDFIPAKTKLVPVLNRGRTYPVPETHLGNKIDSTNVIEVAEHGARFYVSFLNDVEAYFVK
jgi:hypothetical protein